MGAEDSRLDPPKELLPDRLVEIAAGQYQEDPDEPKRRLMAVIGVAFGAAYVIFVAAWIWDPVQVTPTATLTRPTK